MAGFESRAWRPHSSSFHMVVLAFASLFIASRPCPADDIYKYVDRDGTVTYSSFKPRGIVYEKLEPYCLYTYVGCALSNSDWNRVPLNHAAYKEQISDAAKRHGVDAALIRAVVHAESNFNHRAVCSRVRRCRCITGKPGMRQVRRRFGRSRLSGDLDRQTLETVSRRSPTTIGHFP